MGGLRGARASPGHSTEVVMAKRQKMSKRKSKKLFSRTAGHSQSANFRGSPMRGGIRL